MTVILDGLNFAEGPRWYNGELWFSDIHGHRVVAVKPDGKSRTVAEFGDRPSGLGFLPGGDLLVVQMIDRRLVRVDASGAVHPHADVSHLSGHFINDMVVDRRGNAYVGSRSGNGSFSFTWYDNTEPMYVDAYEDSTHLGRSTQAVANGTA